MHNGDCLNEMRGKNICRTRRALELAEGVEIVPAWLCVAGCVLRLEKAGDFFPQKNAKNDDFDASYWP
jgi:hypothetical protein